MQIVIIINIISSSVYLFSLLLFDFPYVETDWL